MGNDIEIRVRVSNQTQGGLTAVNTSLRALRQNADNAAQSMRTLATRSGAATQSLRLVTNRAQEATRALRELDAAGNVRIAARFDGQVAQITATARAMRDLRGDSQRTGAVFSGLTARAAAAAAALARLEREAVGAARALEDLQHQAAQTAAAMTLLSRSVASASNHLNRFNQRAETANTRIRDLSDGATNLQGDFDRLGGAIDGVNGGLGDLRGSFGRITVAGDSASHSLGGGGGAGAAGGGLKGSLIGIGVAVGASVLPSLGALSPMLFGLAGVGGAAALAMDDLKKEFKKLKPEVEALQKAASKTIMPGVKRSMDDWRGALKGLNPVVKEGGEAFGDFVERAADFANSPAFKSSLLKNVQMGSGFFKDFTGSLMDFTQSFLDFGTKSQPSLDAFQNLFGGMLDRGLPGMFKEMEQGISGSADVIDGLAYLLNDALLPSIGKIAGAFADSFGPLTKEMLITAGNQIKLLATAFDYVAEALEPLADFVADAFRAWNELFTIGASVAGSFAKEVGGALLDSLAAVAGVDTSQLDDGFHGLSDWVKENQGQIRGAFLGIAQAITSMVIVGVESMPKLFGAFRFMTEGILTAIDGLVSTLAGTFGELPGIGEVFKAWNDGFDEIAGGFREDMDSMGSAIDGFVDEAVPRLNRAQIKMNVDQAEASLDHIKQQLKDPDLTKERKAKLTADKKDAEAKLAAAKQELADFDKKQAKAKLDAEPSSFWGKIRAAITARIPKKTALVDANTSPFRAGVGGIIGRVLGTAYINVQRRIVESSASPAFRAMGGPIRRLAGGGAPEGGRVVGPGTETSDSIPAMLSAGEYVVRASSVRKYGERFLADINEGRLKPQGFAGGGTVRKLARGARDEIKAATSGTTEKNLLRLMDSISKGHIKMATALKQVTSALDKAKDKLSDLKNSASALANSVKSGILSDASITKSAGAESAQVTINTLLSEMQGSATRSKDFDRALKALKKRGLSKDLIRQIAEAGIEGGGLETATAILGGGKGEIKELNRLQGQISKSAKSAGKTTADLMYGAQIKSQEKLVKALDKLADAIKSRVKKKASGGVAGGLTIVGEEGPELVHLPYGSMVSTAGRTRRAAWDSMLNEPGASPVYRGTGRGAQPIVIHQTITLDGRVVARQIFDPLREEIAHRGGNVQQSLGRG